MKLAARINIEELLQPSGYWAALETVLITLALPIIGGWVHSEDPFFLHAAFPWLIMAPLLSALRYGFAYGFGSALGLVLLIAAAWRMHWGILTEFPGGFALGMLVVGMISGEFSDMWSKREARQRTLATYHRSRLDEFTRAYHMLRVSHDRLEQRLAAGSQSLRFSLMQVRQLLLGSSNERNVLASAAEAIMAIFAEFSWLQVAELYAVDKGGRISEKPLVRLGDAEAVHLQEDPLVLEAMRSGELVSVRSSDSEHGMSASSGVLAAVPFVDINGRIWALLTVHEMPFVSFQQQNLMLLAVMGGYIADQVSAASGRVADSDSSGNVFLRDTERALIQRRKHGLAATVQTISIHDPDLGEGLLEVLSNQVRGLDRIWLHRTKDGAPVLFLLMPLTNEAQAGSYRIRISRYLHEMYGKDAGELGVEFHGREIEASDSIDGLVNYLCEVGGIENLDISNRSRPDG